MASAASHAARSAPCRPKPHCCGTHNYLDIHREALVKYRLGKLPLPASPHIYLPEQRRRHRIETLPLDEPSVARLAGLPDLHRDPFDRMLVCQALEHGLTLATVDPAVRAYPVPVW
nr:type II toxin-antitoxin system VapC family toxin [uncultured Thiohalocapsa sp.]